MPIEKLLALLEKIDGYPFDPAKDHSFVAELLDEFPEVDFQEELIRFRLWLSECRPYPRLHYRLVLRKWIKNASTNN